MIRTALLALAVVANFALTVSAEAQSRCTYPDDRAADGSRCGGRASTVRPGGR